MMSQASFWDADDITEPIHVRDTIVGPASTADVTEFCQRYHYTNTGGNAAWRWGLWHGVTMLGVVAYNLPTRDACEGVFGAEHFDKVWHMGRLALADIAPHNSESRLIAGSLRAIEEFHPTVWGVLTYAATDVGHIGYVYQATNALYTGVAGHTNYFVDSKGARRPDYFGGQMVSVERGREMGWTRVKGSGKHRYVYLLGNKRERRERRALLRYPVLPYPKAALLNGSRDHLEEPS